MTRVVQIRCPACQMPVFSRPIGNVFQCEHCKAISVRENKPVIIDMETGEFARKGTGERLYMPFWAMDIAYHIDHVTFDEEYPGQESMARDGSLTVYIPAFEIEAESFSDIAMGMIENPPHYKAGVPREGIRHMPCIMTTAMARKMAHYIFITLIAEGDGKLQDLGYRIDLKKFKLIYLPYYRDGDEYRPGY